MVCLPGRGREVGSRGVATTVALVGSLTSLFTSLTSLLDTPRVIYIDFVYQCELCWKRKMLCGICLSQMDMLRETQMGKLKTSVISSNSPPEWVILPWFRSLYCWSPTGVTLV